MAKHYIVDNEKREIRANIPLLTEKEQIVIDKFRKNGYKVINDKEGMKKEKKSGIDDNFIVEYLEKNDKNGLDEYKAEKDTPAVDEKGKPKKTKNGKTRKRGFSAGLIWFEKRYPQDIDSLRLTTKQKEIIAEQYENYIKSKDDDIMTKEQYTRYYYWKKIYSI